MTLFRKTASVLAAGILVAHGLAGVSVKSAYSREMGAEDFERISEFFTGQENTSGRLILRSQPDSRDGIYFILLLDTPAASLPAGSVFKGEVIRSDRSLPLAFEWKVPAQAKSGKEVLLGLTGADWNSEAINATAWRITLVDANGNSLAEFKSYLWQLPAQASK